jgi:hypothetical protein
MSKRTHKNARETAEWAKITLPKWGDLPPMTSTIDAAKPWVRDHGTIWSPKKTS